MSYSKQIFEMLELEPNEWFKIKGQSGREFRMNNKLQVFYRRMSDRIEFEHFSVLYSILAGISTIIKIPQPTPNEQIAIDYARVCGYHWIAKDKNGAIFAFINKPIKNLNENEWNSDEDLLYIRSPISFIHWEDDEPYYIGD